MQNQIRNHRASILKNVITISLLTISGLLKCQQILPVLQLTDKEKSESALMGHDSAENEKNKDDDRIFVFGVGSTDALQLDKITASGGLNIGVRLHPRLTAFMNFNFGGKVSRNEPSDSVYLSSFYFPDIASTAFAAAADWSFLAKSRSQLLLSGEGSVQQRNIERDSSVMRLGIANLSFGPKFRWTHKNKERSQGAVFTAGIFYNIIFLNDGSEKDFNTFFNPKNKVGYKFPHDLQGLSGLISIQLNNSLIYFRTYTDLKTGMDLSFTVGIKATGEFISF